MKKIASTQSYPVSWTQLWCIYIYIYVIVYTNIDPTHELGRFHFHSFHIHPNPAGLGGSKVFKMGGLRRKRKEFKDKVDTYCINDKHCRKVSYSQGKRTPRERERERDHLSNRIWESVNSLTWNPQAMKSNPIYEIALPLLLLPLLLPSLIIYLSLSLSLSLSLLSLSNEW